MSSLSTPVFRSNLEELSHQSSELSDAIVLNTEIRNNPTHSVQQKQLILSVAWWGGKLGAAYYDIISHELHVIPDIVENVSDTCVFRGLFFQLEPHTLIIKQNLDEKRMTNIYQLLRNMELEDNSCLFNETQSDAIKTGASIKFTVNEKDSCHLYIVPSSYYNAEAATRRLRALRLGIAPDDMTEMERWIHLRSLFPFDHPALLQATGALLKMLEQWRRGQDVDRLNEMNVDDNTMKIFSIRTCRADDLLWMDKSAFLSLKIFSQESHPSAFKKGHSQSSKEG